jgi:hypothetical protein
VPSNLTLRDAALPLLSMRHGISRCWSLMLRRAAAPSSRRRAACASREKRPVLKYEAAPLPKTGLSAFPAWS